MTVGEDVIEAGAKEIIIAPAGTPHKFVDVGSNPLRQINIHPVARM